MKDSTKDFLTALTDVELETESKLIFALCETARDLELFKTERPIMDSFLEWARSESWKQQNRIIELDNGKGETVEPGQNAPIQTEIIPVEPAKNEFFISVKIKTARQMIVGQVPEILREEINGGIVEILEVGTYEAWEIEKGRDF